VLPWKRHEKTIINTHISTVTRMPYPFETSICIVCCVCVVGHKPSCDVTRCELSQISGPAGRPQDFQVDGVKILHHMNRRYSAINIIGFRTPNSTTPTMTVTSATVIPHLPILLPFQMSLRTHARIYTCCQYRTIQQQLLRFLSWNTEVFYGSTVLLGLGIINV
jgi:hypothetical protein